MESSDVDEPGCSICRSELESGEMPHLVNVFTKQVPSGDLSGLQRRVIQAPTDLTEVDGHVTYQNDFVYSCIECKAWWLVQYWEVQTPATQYSEFGERYRRDLPLSEAQVAVVSAAIKAGSKLAHDQFAQ
jgi:hypothetical protein